MRAAAWRRSTTSRAPSCRERSRVRSRFGSAFAHPARLDCVGGVTGPSVADRQGTGFLDPGRSVEGAPEKVEPRFQGSLLITTRLNEITVRRGNFSPETYRVDGTPTDLGSDRFGSALLVADGIVLSTRRPRQLPAGPTATIYSDYFRLDGDVLTVDSVHSQSRPDGTLASMENTRVIIRYRRVRQ